MQVPAAARVVHQERRLGAWLLLALLITFVYATGYDQGFLLHPFLGKVAETNNYLHEFFHDGRHLLGFPCH